MTYQVCFRCNGSFKDKETAGYNDTSLSMVQVYCYINAQLPAFQIERVVLALEIASYNH